MPLESLPTELVFTIGGFLDPFSSFAFALTNKHNWRLYHSIISRHKRLFAENRTIDAFDSEYPYKNHVLWDKLREILDDNAVGEYVRDISLPSRRATYLDGDVSDNFQLSAHPTRPPREDIDRYTIAKREMENVYEWDPTTLDHAFLDPSWDEWILKGSSEPIIVMLIHYLPYLSVFRFTDVEMKHVFKRALEHIARSYGNPSLAPKLPFQHLTTVAVAHWDTEFSCDHHWYFFFCTIPSVRNFVADAMSGEFGEFGDSLHEDLPVSNASELVFHNSVFSTPIFRSIVRHAPKLEKFSYEIGGATVSYETVVPRRDLQALVDHVGHSLQHLVYEFGSMYDGYGEDEDLPSVSLRGFQQLKTLRIDSRLLQPAEDESTFDNEEKSDGGFYKEEEEEERPYMDEEFDLRSVLPASLEKLYVTGPICRREQKWLEKAQNSESEFTPLLKHIYMGESYICSDMEGMRDHEDVPNVHQNPLMRFLEGQGCEY